MVKLSFKKLAIGTGLAAVGGYITGLLTAPKAGRETREDLKQKAQLGAKAGEEQLTHLVSELNTIMENVKNQAADLGAKSQSQAKVLVSRAKDARDKADSVLDAIHKGGSSDKDLDVAVNEVTRAVKHLRSFLKK
jgi:gas vesicle protein